MGFNRYRKVSDSELEKSNSPSITQRFTATFVEYVMWMIFLSLFPLLGWKCIKRVKPNNALVKHRLGHNASVKYSGYDVILPWIDRATEVNIGPQNILLPSSTYHSKDKVLMESGLVVVYQVKDPAICVRELQDIQQSVILASKTALPTVLSQNNSNMISCSKKLIEYAVTKNINNAVCMWGIEVVSAELSPFKFTAPPKDDSSESPISIAINFIQKLAGHNPLPPKESFSIDEMIIALKPYLTRKLGEDVNAVALLQLTGDKGGKCLIDFKTQTMVSNPSSCHPDVTIEMSVDTLLSMMDERESLMDVYKTGRIKIEGDLDAAWRLQKLF